MKENVGTELVTALVLVLIGAIFIFKPELVGIIIGVFLILMGVNSLIKAQKKVK
jgi:multisubunit Na+/H+ antiporter MnhC subunit